jgi:hypothetical protein
MFDFWYNKMTKNSPCEFNLGMSDTDSFLFEVTKPKLFWKSVEPYMDFSNYDKDHPKFSEGNKAKLGFFKDELCGGKKCVEFIGLRPKCYALNLVDKKSNVESEKKICKGLGRAAIKNRLRFSQYKNCLENEITQRHEFSTIRSTKHNIKTLRQKKKALSHFDCKRWLFDCGIHSVPYGSKYISKYYNRCMKCK